MPNTRIPSPARSQGPPVTPRRYKTRTTRSVGSPARSTASGRLSNIVDQFKENNKDSFAASPLSKTILSDNTEIDVPRRQSWWKKVENSRDMIAVLEDEKLAEPANVLEEFDMESLCQEKENCTIDLPESSGNESIKSIVVPQRRLFVQKQNQPQLKFGDVVSTSSGNNTQPEDKTIHAGTKNLFSKTSQLPKPVFPSALLNITAETTLANKTKELPEDVKAQPKVLFGRPGTKRKNVFADFVFASESEDEIPEIVPKRFTFHKPSEPSRRSSNASSVTTDIDMDDWKLLPSSTMVEHQLEAELRTPGKRARLSKLSEAKESTNTDSTKQSNKSMSKNKSKLSPAKNQDAEMSLKVTTQKHNTSQNRSKTFNKTKNISQAQDIGTTANEEVKESSTVKNKTYNINQTTDKQVSKSQIVENVEDVQISDKTEFTEKQNTSQNKSKTCNKTKNISQAQDIGSTANEEAKETSTVKNKTYNINKTTDDQPVATTEEYVQIEELAQVSGQEDVAMNENVPEKASEESEQDQAQASEEIKASEQDGTDAEQELEDDEEAEQQKEETEEQIEASQEEIKNNDQIDEQQNATQEMEEEQEIELNYEEDAENNEEGVIQESADVDQNESQTNEEELQDECVEVGKRARLSKLSEAKESTNTDSTKQSNKSMSSKNNSKLSPAKNQEAEMSVKETTHKQNTSQNKSKTFNKSKNISQAQDYGTTANEEAKETSTVKNKTYNVNQTTDEQPVATTEENVQIEKLAQVSGQEDEAMDENIPEKEASEDQLETSDQDQAEASQEIEASDQEGTDAEQEIEADDDNDDDEQQVDDDDEEEEEQEEDKEETDEQIEASQEEIESNDEIDEDQNASQEMEEEIENNDEIDEEQNASQEMEEEEEIENNDEIDEEQNAMEDEQEVEQDDEEDAEVDNDELHESDDVAQNASQANEEEVQNEIVEEEAQDESEDEGDEQNESQEMEEEQENEEIDDEEEQNESQEAEEVEDDQEMEEDVIEASEEMQEDVPETEQQEIEGNVTHDTTGRNRKKRKTNTPEAILHDATNEMESFIAKGRNTSIRKTSLKNFNIRPSLAPARESTGLSDGTKNSSAEGSGWDSHRTTRKTLRQTFGKDFTPRKSLRALVMEKSAKRQTQINEANEALRHQANSTEIPNDHEEMDYENMEPESDHEISRRTRQTTLEMYLQKIKKENMEFKQKIEQQVKNSFKSNPVRVDILNFKPNKLTIRRMNAKSLQTAPKIKRAKSSVINLENLPQEFIEDMKYKPPKRFKPTNASWITKRLYKFLESKLEPKYDYKARVRAEKLVETIYNFVRETRRARVAPPHLVAELQREMARLDVVKTYFEFYSFFGEYLPTEVKIKVVPDIVNDIPLPSGGVFAEIMV